MDGVTGLSRVYGSTPVHERKGGTKKQADEFRQARISTEAMVKLCDRYALDGLFVGSVTAWRPYTPPHLGLRTQLISVHSGSSIWAVDTIFDSSDRSTISDLQHYVLKTQRDDGNLHGWEMTLLSPSKFTNFVAHRCVGTWVES